VGYKIADTLTNGKRESDLVINDNESSLVYAVFDALDATGGNIGRTAITLNEAGYRTRTGQRFMPNTVRKIAARKLYIGIMESPLTDKIIHRGDLQIISVEQFDRVQALIKNRQRPTPGAKGRYPFTGFVVCGTCGGPMVGTKNGNTLYYACVTRRKFGPTACAHGRHYRGDWLAEATAGLITEAIENSGIMEKILNNAANAYGKTVSEEALEAAIDGETKVIKEQRNRLIEAIAAGVLTQAEAAVKLDSLRESEGRLIVERANISKKVAIRDDFLKAIKVLRTAPIKDKLITTAKKQPAMYRKLLWLFFEPNSLQVDQTFTLTITGYQFTEAFSSAIKEASFCNIVP
jgi:site-specific DNA recombinase